MANDAENMSDRATWTANLRHRPDPNRVPSLQTLIPSPFAPHPPTASSRSSPASSLPSPGETHGVAAEPSYYDVPLLKPPVWQWQIASYVFLGGLSAGAYLLGRVADRAGGPAYRRLSRIGTYVAWLTMLLCPPLLIADLGDPKRFHHMLRVWKPSSPMNLGTWSLVAYSGMVTSAVVRQYLNERGDHLRTAERRKLRKLMNNGVLLALHDAAGIPCSLLVTGYTGLLLSCTSNPLWSKNPWLGPLFSASAISTGAEAVSLALDCTAKATDTVPPGRTVLNQVDTLAHVAEVISMAGFLRVAGKKAAPLRQGTMRRWHYVSLGSLLASELLKLLPWGRSRKSGRMLSAGLGLLAGFSMRWAMVFGGQEAAKEPHTSRLASRPKRDGARGQRSDR